MDELSEIIKGKELVVIKKVASIIEKVLRVFDLDFSHDRYKQIIYEQIELNTPLEEKLKSYYDGFMYLLHNKRTPITSSFLSKFYYLVTNRKLSENIGIKLASIYFYLNDLEPVEKAIKFHMTFYKELKELEEYEKTLISLMIFNFILVREQIPIVQIVRKDLKKYLEYRKKFIEGDEKTLNNFLNNILSKSKYQNKSYYKKLKELTLYDVEQCILNQKEKIKNEFKVSSIFIFGSFCKGNYRIDSDIDLLVCMNEGMSYKEKVNCIEGMNKYLMKELNRYIDICEISTRISDDFLIETTKVKKVF